MKSTDGAEDLQRSKIETLLQTWKWAAQNDFIQRLQDESRGLNVESTCARSNS